MKHRKSYSMAKVVFVIFTFIFSITNVAFAATNFKELMEGEEFLSKRTKEGRVIIELMEFKKGRFFSNEGRLFTEGEPNGGYEIIGNKVIFWGEKESKAEGIAFALKEKGGVVYMSYQGISIFSISRVPVGYQELREIQANNNVGKKPKVVSLSRKLLKNKKLDPKIGIAVSEILLQNQEFQLASQGFRRFGKEGRVSLCKIMEIAIADSIPNGLDVLKIAKIAWDDNCENNFDIKFSVPRAEGIAYVFALAGDYDRAYDYQCQLCQLCQRQKILQAAEVQNARIDGSRLVFVAKQYKQRKIPSERFKMSLL